MTKSEKSGDAPEQSHLKLLGKDDILSADDLKYEIVPVPEWGGSVRVRSLPSEERDAYEQSCLVGKGKDQRVTYENIRAKLCSRTIVDDGGERIFSDADIALLGKKSAAALMRVFEAASRLSALNKEDVDKLAGELKNAPTAEP